MLQILMPMAGHAKPFVDHGHTFPKALIEVRGHPLIEYAIRSVTPAEDHRFIFVVDEEQVKGFYLDDVLTLIAPENTCVGICPDTDGALCTALLAIDMIVDDDPLIICNGDQFLGCGIDDAMADFRNRDLDIGIVTFTSFLPRWSFVRRDGDGFVVETAEKRPISSEATVGIYYFKRAAMFIDAAQKAMYKSPHFNGQYYVCPSINESILAGLKVGAYQISNDDFHPLGIPEDVSNFSEHFPESPLD